MSTRRDLTPEEIEARFPNGPLPPKRRQVDPFDALILAIVFMNAAAAIVAGAGGDEVTPLVKLLCAALASGCGAVLAFLRPVGKG